MKINSLAILFLIAILLPANIVPAFSQTSSNNLENFLVELSLSPSHVDEYDSTHSVGYVMVKVIILLENFLDYLN